MVQIYMPLLSRSNKVRLRSLPICVYGRGWVQLEGEPAHELKGGEVFNIPPNVKHWHGAAKDSWFQHLSLEVPGEGTSNEWLEPVTDEVYDKLP